MVWEINPRYGEQLTNEGKKMQAMENVDVEQDECDLFRKLVVTLMEKILVACLADTWFGALL